MSNTDWSQLVVEDASVQVIHLDEIIVHSEFSEALAEQNGFFFVKSPGGATKLFRNLIHLLEFLAKWMRFRLEGRIGCLTN